MILKDIKGNDKIIARLSEAARRGNISHAYIFEGDSCVDKLQIANCFIKAILCESHRGEGCDSCRTCQRIEHGNNEDIFYAEAEGASLKDEVISEMQNRLRRKPYESDRNIAVIKDADSMTVRAQNRLLKTLEEPEAGTVIILLSENTENLIPTILSRCITFRFNPFGTPGYAAMSGSADEIIEMILEQRPFYSLKAKLSDVTGDKDASVTREKAYQLLDAMEIVYGDLAVGKHRSSRLYRKTDIYRAVEAIEQARRDLQLGVNTAYALKNMVIRIGG